MSEHTLSPTKTMSSETSSETSTETGDLCPPALRSRGYEIGELIGGGGFSKVYKASNTKFGNKDIACKRIEIKNVDQAWRDKCMKLELKIIKKLQHPNIIKIYEVIKTRKVCFIFMDLAVNGTVYGNLTKSRRPFSEKQTKIWSSQIISAICYIHSKGIAHRDIKLDNFLLDYDLNALLSDFGFACLTNSESKLDELIQGTMCGTMEYMAPEVRHPPYHAKEADMFSMGVCIYEMLNYHKPYSDPNNNEKEILRKMLNKEYRFHGNIEKKLSDKVKDIIYKLLEPNPKMRLTAVQAMQHPWLAPTFTPQY